MRTLLAATKRLKWLALAAAIGTVGVGFAAPASAHDDGYSRHRHYHRQHHHERHDHHRHHWRPHHSYAPPRVHYQAPPRYVAPPVYRPYYESGVSLNFNLR